MFLELAFHISGLTVRFLANRSSFHAFLGERAVRSLMAAVGTKPLNNVHIFFSLSINLSILSNQAVTEDKGSTPLPD